MIKCIKNAILDRIICRHLSLKVPIHLRRLNLNSLSHYSFLISAQHEISMHEALISLRILVIEKDVINITDSNDNKIDLNKNGLFG